MNMKNTISIVIGTAGLSIAGLNIAAAAADTPPVAESTPSEIKSPTPLAEQIDAYNANRTTSSAERGSARTAPGDSPIDPKTESLADEINAYNASSQPDDSTAAIDERQPATIDRERSFKEREATDRLSNDVRQYNESGGASAFSDDGDE